MFHRSKIRRIRYWTEPVGMILTLPFVLFLPIFLLVSAATMAILLREYSSVILYIVMLAAGSAGCWLIFEFMRFFFDHFYVAYQKASQRFEGIITTDRENYNSGTEIRFSYADRVTYASPTSQMKVELQYFETKRNDKNAPPEDETLLYTDSKSTSAYNLGAGLTFQLPEHSDSLNLTGQYDRRFERKWRFRISDGAGFEQVIPIIIWPAPNPMN